VVQLDPNDAFAYEEGGDLLCQLGQFADAVKAYPVIYQDKNTVSQKMCHAVGRFQPMGFL
jgi:hypothetical protein